MVEANIQLEDSTLRAPYDGVIAQRFVEERQNIRAKEPVVQFQDVDEIDIAVDVPETVMAADIRSADIVQMVAEFSGAPGLQFPVRIKEIAQVADPMTQTFQVRVAMKSPPGMNVLPGMTATVTLTYRRASILGERILVPISAVFKDAAGEQVAWVIGPDQTVIAPPGETRRGDGRPDRNRRRAATGRPHRRGGGDVPARRHEGSRPGRRTRRRPVMNPGVFSVRNNRVLFVAMLFVLVGGIVAYQQMGRLEDPEFTIKEALIITPYPGASAEEVAKEVTNPIESACSSSASSSASSRSPRAAGRWSPPSSRTGTTRTRSPRSGTSCAARSATSNRSCRPRCAAGRW